MATILSSQKSSVGSPYAFYTVYAWVNSRTPTSANIGFQVDTHLQYSDSWLGTGHGLTGYLNDNSIAIKSSSASWSGTSTHSVSGSISVGVSPSTTSIGFTFGVSNSDGSACSLNTINCSSLGCNSISSETSNCSMSTSNLTQASCVVKLSNLPSVSYARDIRWYMGSTKVGTTSSAQGTSASYTFSGLMPNTNYTFKADIYSSGTKLTDKSITITTANETGSLAVSASTTYLNVNVSNMFAGPSYTREIDVYYKKSSETDYRKYTTLSSQGSSASTQITSLVSGETYNVYYVIRNGSVVLKTSSVETATTIADSSLVPRPQLNSVTQVIGTLNVIINWLTNKEVSGTKYALMVKVGSGDWETLEELYAVESPKTETITLPSGSRQEYCDFKIVATNTSLAVASNTSNLIEDKLIRDTFEWTTEKVKGEALILSAEEWNRLRDYTVAKNELNGYHVSIPDVVQGQRITAEIYNTMKSAISNVNEVPYSDREPGDEISADCLNALRTAINS